MVYDFHFEGGGGGEREISVKLNNFHLLYKLRFEISTHHLPKSTTG